MNSCNRTFTLVTEKNLVTVVIFHADEELGAGSNTDSVTGWNFIPPSPLPPHPHLPLPPAASPQPHPVV